ncbi:MAG TPA: glycosyltransferase [Solirubrobacteraceae bacterium]|nr:glycosyltransferase [Solirubrobacteraceae bacterium]
MTVVEAIFWAGAGLLVYAQLGYPALLALLGLRGSRPALSGRRPASASIVTAAHDEAAVIAAKVANGLALDWPRDSLQVVVCADGCSDDTAARARAAGADVVLELDRVGKIPALDAGVAASTGELLVFTDANVELEPDALARIADAFADPRVGYACGQVVFRQAAAGRGADNQEGLYWRYEMAVRSLESRLASVTAGNGGLHAIRRDAYVVIDPRMDHDIYVPFHMVKRGLLALYAPAARGVEKMVPSIEGELARKRRFMAHVWVTVLRGGMLSPRGYGPLYALMIASHRVLRYAAPFLHLVALVANALLLGRGALYDACFGIQLALLAAAALGRLRPFLVCRYYVAMNAAIALGLWDYLTKPTVAFWEAPEGTR